MAGEFDIGPLTWVKGEIDQALEKSLACLRAYAANPAESTQLKFSRTHFHQAHGALQIVGLDGVTRVSEELEGLIGETEKSGEPPKPEALAAAEHAYEAISSYLDQLLAGEPNQPLLLFSVYRDLAAARGKDSADPVDLYYPDLSRRPPRRERAPTAHTGDALIQHYRDARARYQRGLVKLIKKDPTGAEDMRAAVAAVEASQSVPAQRTFWWIALGFFDALVARAVPDSPTLMRLCNRIEHQLKRLVEGSTNVAERLMREALFAVARARPATEHLRHVQETFELAGSIPGSFERKAEASGQLPGVRAMRELVTQSKTSWNKAASGHEASLAAFRDQTAQLAARAAESGDDLLKALATDIAVTAKWLGDSPDKVSDAVAMEVATALLLVENATENYARLGEEFKQQVALMRGRLQGVMQGKMPEGAAPVLDEMSRRAQERLLMSQVVGEINASLRAVEQALDAFFRDSSQRPELAALDKPLRQVLGALTMLNEDRAAAALSTCSTEIQRFASPDYAPAQADFERVAGTLSGLGFYVDALQHGKADFDAFMTPIGARKEAPAEEAEAAQASTSVEAGLAKSKREVQALFEQWKKEPADAALKAKLKESLQALQKDASLTADSGLEGRVAEMLDVLKKSDAKTFDPVSTQTLEGITPAAAEPPPSAKTEELVAASAEKVDEELLSVYLEEAGEVLATIGERVEQVRAEPHNIEELRTIRRGFHTLKGSGRMVGLTRLGEVAWAVEQVMNKWLEEERPATPDLLKLVAEAQAFFGAAVEDLKGGGAGPDEAAIVALAQQVKSGEPLAEAAVEKAAPEAPVSEEQAAAPASEEAPAPEAAIESAAPALAEPTETLTVPQEAAPEIDFPAFDLPAAEAAPGAPEMPETPAAPEMAPPAKEPALGPISLDFSLPMPTLKPAPDAPQAPSAVEPPAEDLLPTQTAEATETTETTETKAASEGGDDTVKVGDVELSRALYDIFVSESREHLDGIAEALRAVEGGGPVSIDVRRAAHTLAGIAGTVQFESMWAVGHSLEHMLHRAQDRQLDPTELGIARDALAKLEEMAAGVAVGVAPLPAPDLVARLDAAGEEVSAESPATTESGDQPDTLTLPSDESAGDALDFTAPTPPTPEAEEPPAAPGNVVSFPAAGESAAAAPPLDVKVEEIPIERRRSPREEPSAAPPRAARGPDVTVEEIPVERRTRRLDDDIDPELLPIFLEEAHDLIPAVGQGLRDWRASPEHAAAGNALQRVLHTLKGSARMCGAMALGELTHAMETKVENALGLKTLPETLFDELETSYDRMGLLFDRMQHPDALAPAPPEPAPAAPAEPAGDVALDEAPAPEEPESTPTAAEPTPTEAPAAPVAAPTARPAGVEQDPAAQTRAMLRVRAEVIDRLVNEAGEVSIARSRIEGELRALKVALSELTDNTNRLRTQLREIEIQAETQMQSRLTIAQESEAAFDPLEFDRFTRFQEITRIMAESVNDVATVQQNILRAVGDADGALSAQSRLTRSLQTDLMRIRMVPFSSVSERLYRVVRQAAKETEKRAVLDIRGGQVELDRSVLERITAPFEHMLRNSVAHGVEPPAKRIELGKPELGEIKIEVRQEGNEIMLMVSDDGAGLNLPRILEKARGLGLIEPGQTPSNAEIADFIFHPGFSTASEVSQLAGRGVGMDVVKSEAAALGGRIETHTELGKGTRFLIYLPLTLAVTQAVLVRAGPVRFAIPAVMVEQVRQVKAPELAACNESGEAQWQNRSYPFRYLPRLLGDFDSQPEQKRFHSIMFVRSGAQVVAINVDEVSGAQEIVVKNTGPLLSRIAGITGATVLGSGEIVLIINPVILAGREPIAFVTSDAAVAAQEPAPLITIPTVMIVDDSLTVRKITGRLLSREGYHVLTAKDGVDAVEQLQESIPDVMLVDIEMPRMDGFDLTRAVRGDPRLRHIPIIMITSRTAERHRAYAKEIGVNVYLGKPYQEEELLGNIANFVGKSAPAAV
ncbi:MAG: Hpt domain-containing protein [Betaproteobacteria bacterium]|nr:Hpt domain-containing protein [Betaproteobacteria bacterium]